MSKEVASAVDNISESLLYCAHVRQKVDYLMLLVRSEGATADASDAAIDLLQELYRAETCLEDALGQLAMASATDVSPSSSESN